MLDFLKKPIKKTFKILTHIKVSEKCLEEGQNQRAYDEAGEALKLSPGHKKAEELRSKAGSARFRELHGEAEGHFNSYIERMNVARLEQAKRCIENALEVKHGVPDTEREKATQLWESIEKVTEHVPKFKKAQEFHGSSELEACLKLLNEISGFPKADELRPQVEGQIRDAKKLYEDAADESNLDEAKGLLAEAASKYADYSGRKSLEERLERAERIDAIIRKSKEHFSKGELEEAYRLAKSAWDELTDKNVSEWYEHVKSTLVAKYRIYAQEARGAGELEEAIATYKQLLEIDQYDSDAKRELGSLESVRTRLELLVEEGGQGIVTKNFMLAFEKLTSAKGQAFNFNSIDSLERRLNAELDALKNGGLSEFDDGRLDEAVEQWEMLPDGSEQFKEVNSKLNEAKGRLESANERVASVKKLVETRDFETAKKTIDEAIELHPRNADAIDLRTQIERKLQAMGLVREARQKYEAAELDEAWRLFEQSLRMEPEDEEVRKLRETLKPKRDELLRRCELIEGRLDEIDPDGAMAELESARSLGFSFARLDETAQKVEQVVGRVDSLFASAEEAMAAKQFSVAAQRLEALLKLNRSHQSATELLEEARRRADEYEMFLKADTYFNVDDYVRCIRELETLLGKYPASEDGKNLMEQAKEKFTDKTLSDAKNLIGAGRLGEAERRCAELLNVIPENDEAGTLISQIQTHREQATTLVEEARQGISSGELNLARQKLAQAKRLDVDRDVSELESRLTAKEKAVGLLAKARECESKDELSEGMRLAREAFEVDPELREARELFERLQLMTGISGSMQLSIASQRTHLLQADIPDIFVIPLRIVDIGHPRFGEGNDIYFDMGNVSRKHAQLVNEEGQFYVTDLGSSYGTFINDVRLNPRQKQAIHDGDALGLGQMVRLKFSQRDGSSSAVLTIVDMPDEVKAKLDEVEPIMLETMPQIGLRLVFIGESVTLGGGVEDEIRDKRMGRETQAALKYKDDRFWLEPAEGGEVFVNDEKIDRRTVIQPDDEVKIGALLLEFREVERVMV